METKTIAKRVNVNINDTILDMSINTMYIPTIGLEIHAELLTDSKLFCGCRNSPNDAEPNQHICPVCVGYPGSMPYINKKAIEHMIKIGVALEGEISDFTEFDRKHYFYPDIPKGYQISQYEYPIVSNAKLAGVHIQRVHLEEDTAKSSHDIAPDGSVIDFNRSGVPLMELVTDPTIHTGEDAEKFAVLLQQTLQYLGVALARMEWGEMRVEANISVSKDNTLGTKVEIKNLNSFKSVRNSIEYEILRQTDLLESGQEVVQETRGWDDGGNKTFSQRIKENSEEYRYMPEPDLPKFYLHREWDIEKMKNSVIELPEKRFNSYIENYNIPEKQVYVLVHNKKLGDVFDVVIGILQKNNLIKLAANYLTSDVIQYIEHNSNDIFTFINGEGIAELVQMIDSGDISSRGAKDIIEILVKEGGSPRDIAKQKKLFQQSDEDFLLKMIDKIIDENTNLVNEYKNGKESVLQFFIGQAMKESKGSANPQKLQELLKKRFENFS